MSQIILPHQMDFSLLDERPFRPGWGRIWQGGSVTQDIYQIPGPLAIVCMNRKEFNEECIDHKVIHTVLAVWIDDTTKSMLPDRVLMALVDSAIGLLKNGVNLYVHCLMGISRSTYFTVALYMRLGMSFKEALNHVKGRRKIAWPNWGFYDQLRRLEAAFHGDGVGADPELVVCGIGGEGPRREPRSAEKAG